MGDINPKKIPRAKRRGDSKPVIGTGKPIKTFNGTTGSSVKGDTAREPLKMDTRSSLERLGDLRTFNVGRNQTISVGGGLKSPSLTYKLKFKEGGLYENIHKKRARIAAGSGEKMRKVGSKGAPTAADFVKSAKTAKRK